MIHEKGCAGLLHADCASVYPGAIFKFKSVFFLRISHREEKQETRITMADSGNNLNFKISLNEKKPHAVVIRFFVFTDHAGDTGKTGQDMR